MGCMPKILLAKNSSLHISKATEVLVCECVIKHLKMYVYGNRYIDIVNRVVFIK